MDFLQTMTLMLALITTFSVYGPREPIDKFESYEVIESHNHSGLRGIDEPDDEIVFIKGMPLEIILTEETPIEDEKTNEKKESTSSKNSSETKNNSSDKKTNSETKTNSDKKSDTETKKPAQTTKPAGTYFDVPLSENLQDYIFRVCKSYDIEPEIVIAVIWKESSYRASVMGDNGNAYGLMQIQPRWHKERMKKLGVDDLLDPYQNVLVGIDYLAELYHNNGSMKWALMAYNGGPDYATRKIKAGEISSYASSVLKKAKELGR